MRLVYTTTSLELSTSHYFFKNKKWQRSSRAQPQKNSSTLEFYAITAKNGKVAHNDKIPQKMSHHLRQRGRCYSSDFGAEKLSGTTQTTSNLSRTWPTQNSAFFSLKRCNKKSSINVATLDENCSSFRTYTQNGESSSASTSLDDT